MTQLSLNKTKWTDLLAIIGPVICPCQAQKVTGTHPRFSLLPNFQEVDPRGLQNPCYFYAELKLTALRKIIFEARTPSHFGDWIAPYLP